MDTTQASSVRSGLGGRRARLPFAAAALAFALPGLAFAAPTRIDVGTADGLPGGTVEIAVTLTRGDCAAVATSTDLRFDPKVLEAVLEGAEPSCTINPAIGPGTAANKQLARALLDETGSDGLSDTVRIGIFGFNLSQIPDGELFRCTFRILREAPPGSVTLENAAGAANTAGDCPAADVTGSDGAIVVLAAAPTRVDVGTAAGGRGAVVEVPVTLTRGDCAAVGTSNDIRFDPTAIEPLRHGAEPACVINSAIGTGTPANKQLARVLLDLVGGDGKADTLRIGVFGFTLAQVPDGELFRCRFRILGEAPLGTSTLANTPGAGDAGGDCPTVAGSDGAIQVTDVPATRIDVSDGQGAPGTIVEIPVTLTEGSCAAIGTSTDIRFEPSAVRPVLAGTEPDCTINSAIGSGTAADKQLARAVLDLVAGDGAETVRIGVFGFNLNALPSGELFRCRFEILETAPPGESLLVNTPGAADAAGDCPFEAVTGNDGRIRIVPCGNGTIDAPAEECDDGNRDSGDCCDSFCREEPDGGSCDDGAFCNGTDTCSGGSCTHTGDPCVGRSECDDRCNEAAHNCREPAGTVCTSDGNPCTDDQCNGQGQCTHAANTAPCDDDLFCNGTDTCSGGTCVHTGDPCVGRSECDDRCNETTDDCHEPAGTACTSDGNLCTDDQCNGQGQCTHPANTAPCDDDLFCNGTDTCSGGTCVHSGDPCAGTQCNTCQEGTDGAGVCICPLLCGDVDCDEAVSVTDARAVLEFDVGLLACEAPTLACSDFCDITPASEGGGSSPGDGACNSGDALRMGQCAAELIDCTFACMPAMCAPPVGPEPPPSEEPCEVTCEVAGCSGDVLIADLIVNVGENALGAYTLEFQCDPEQITIGRILPGTSAAFSSAPTFRKLEGCHARLAGIQTAGLDGPTGAVSVAQIELLVQTTDMGVETPLAVAVDALFDTAGRPLAAQVRGGSVIVGGCGDDAACDDGNPCNGVETCNVDTCQCQPGTPIVCTDGNLCTVGDVCDPSTGSCLPGTPVACPDADLCNSTQQCDPGTGACIDGPPVNCDDGNACTTGESCDPATGACRPGAPVACAEDGNVCNGVAACDPSRGCVPGTPLVCIEGDQNACTAPSCDPTTGCRELAVADGTACTSTLGCRTAPPSCQDGVCTESFVCQDVVIPEVQIVPRKATKENPQQVDVTCLGGAEGRCQAQAFYELPAKATLRADSTTAAGKTNRCPKKIGKAEKKARARFEKGKKQRAEIPITTRVKVRIDEDDTPKDLGLKLNPIGLCLLQNAGAAGFVARVDTSIQRKGGDTTLLNHVVRLVQGGG